MLISINISNLSRGIFVFLTVSDANPLVERAAFFYIYSLANLIYPPLHSGRIWHKVDFYAEFNRFEFRVILLLD